VDLFLPQDDRRWYLPVIDSYNIPVFAASLIAPLHDLLDRAANADEKHGQTCKLSSTVGEDIWVDSPVVTTIGDDIEA